MDVFTFLAFVFSAPIGAMILAVFINDIAS